MLRFSAAASAAAAAVAALFLDIPQLRQLAVRGLHELLQPVLKVGGLLRGLADKAHGAGTAALAGGPSASAEPLLSSTLAGGARGRRRHLLAIPLAAFIFVVAVTRYVSAGSLLVTIIFLAEVICFGQMGG